VTYGWQRSACQNGAVLWRASVWRFRLKLVRIDQRGTFQEFNISTGDAARLAPYIFATETTLYVSRS
jgi:hypothetical protein